MHNELFPAIWTEALKSLMSNHLPDIASVLEIDESLFLANLQVSSLFWNIDSDIMSFCRITLNDGSSVLHAKKTF